MIVVLVATLYTMFGFGRNTYGEDEIETLARDDDYENDVGKDPGGDEFGSERLVPVVGGFSTAFNWGDIWR